jgi:DNA invertase Pin-like site-specific DNA recombinase
MAIIGYARVSSKDQNLDRQIDALTQAGAEKIFSDKLSGKDTKRPGLTQATDYVREGDTLIVLSFDRLARSLSDLLTITNKLAENKVQFRSLHETVDTSTPQGKLFFHLMGSMAEFERSMIAERRTEGIASARARGKTFGRPKVQKPEAWAKEVRAWKRNTQTAVQTYKKLGLSKSVFYSLLKAEEK